MTVRAAHWIVGDSHHMQYPCGAHRRGLSQVITGTRSRTGVTCVGCLRSRIFQAACDAAGGRGVDGAAAA